MMMRAHSASDEADCHASALFSVGASVVASPLGSWQRRRRRGSKPALHHREGEPSVASSPSGSARTHS
eukprot:CAMPEP_0176128094 /NCGR_PEP_ID=MMETSP0120_2-20121206/64717_1 /TAXON_ID=160619 /ORGANISM="Kryptoperidinium foliaceum, Strain CCMP 1326" /LENGTH=67 /DNA_ID=CAMNT_0017463167 /DNA_START=15 /DNA_END=214 /DNA_ORIENTATION=-